MKFGVVGSSGSARQQVELAIAAERHGWDGFFTWDGLSVGPMDTFDPWTILGAAAVSTERITLGAMIFPLARRRPWKVVRESITVDHLSGGRLVLPVGLGAVDDAGFSRVAGVPLTRRDRAHALDEVLHVLDVAWQGELFSHEGEFFTGRDLVFRPRPVNGRVPVWAVGLCGAERSMARAARHDGVLVTSADGPRPLVPADVAEAVAWISAHRTDPGPFDIVAEGVLPDDRAAAADRARGLAEAGATWWIESRWEGDAASFGSVLAMVEQGPPRG